MKVKTNGIGSFAWKKDKDGSGKEAHRIVGDGLPDSVCKKTFIEWKMGVVHDRTLPETWLACFGCFFVFATSIQRVRDVLLRDCSSSSFLFFPCTRSRNQETDGCRYRVERSSGSLMLPFATIRILRKAFLPLRSKPSLFPRSYDVEAFQKRTKRHVRKVNRRGRRTRVAGTNATDFRVQHEAEEKASSPIRSIRVRKAIVPRILRRSKRRSFGARCIYVDPFDSYEGSQKIVHPPDRRGSRTRTSTPIETEIDPLLYRSLHRRWVGKKKNILPSISTPPFRSKPTSGLDRDLCEEVSMRGSGGWTPERVLFHTAAVAFFFHRIRFHPTRGA